MGNFFKWEDGSIIQYATSIASSWIWAPAIFISSLMAYMYGLEGFLMFFLPNLITLILFSFVANYARNKNDGYTIMDAFNNISNKQKYIHIAIYILILLCSCCTQLIGIQMLLLPIINSKIAIGIIISLIAIITVWKGGLKTSIITDNYKYLVMIMCAIFLLSNVFTINMNLLNMSGIATIDLFMNFGLITALGLLSGVYSDTTLWQRAFSIPKNKVKKTFTLSGLLFAIIPLMFGIIGFCSVSGIENWSLVNQFSSGLNFWVLLICVLSTLLATLDSNLCSISSIPCKMLNYDFIYGKFMIIALLTISCILTSIECMNLTYMFLIYNTVRICIAMPTLMIIFNKYDSNRLFIGTLLAIIIAPIGYIITQNYLFSISGLLLPLIGYKNQSKSLL